MAWGGGKQIWTSYSSSRTYQFYRSGEKGAKEFLVLTGEITKGEREEKPLKRNGGPAVVDLEGRRRRAGGANRRETTSPGGAGYGGRRQDPDGGTKFRGKGLDEGGRSGPGTPNRPKA